MSNLNISGDKRGGYISPDLSLFPCTTESVLCTSVDSYSIGGLGRNTDEDNDLSTYTPW